MRIDCPESEAFAAAGTQPVLWEAFDQLIGAGRWWRRRGVGGTIPVRFPGPDDPGDAGGEGMPFPRAAAMAMAQPGVALHDQFPLTPPLSPVELAMAPEA
jgi:hypothetical protein